MRNVIIAQNKHWEKPYAHLYKRDVLNTLIATLPTKHIQVLQGIRRSGKSTLFKLLINHLCQSVDPQEILYLNLDDPFFVKYSNDAANFYEIIQEAKKLTRKGVTYLFLDEVQAIAGWERFVKSVYDSEEFVKIFITGSNPSLLNGDLATLLTGRYLSARVFPLSFQEILHINQIHDPIALHKALPQVLGLVDDMMRYGSFVEVYDISEEHRRELLTTYYDTILLKDCVANNQIRDIKSFKELSYYLLTNAATPYSYSSLAKVVGIHDRSAKEYVAFLEDSYLFCELKLYAHSLKEQQNNKKKLYASDNGFLSLGQSFSANHGKLLENLVCNELQKNGYEIYFYHKEIECDFIARKADRTVAIQVCYELNEHNQKRELNGLLKLPFAVDERVIITYRQTKNIDGIGVKPFWEYFCYL